MGWKEVGGGQGTEAREELAPGLDPAGELESRM